MRIFTNGVHKTVLKKVRERVKENLRERERERESEKVLVHFGLKRRGSRKEEAATKRNKRSE